MISLDEVATGVLVNAITAVGGWLETAAASARSGRGRAAEDLAVARWFETYQVTSHVPSLPGLSATSMSRLADLLRGDDVQAAVQELLAVRLTDGSNADAARARQAFVLTLATGDAPDPEISRFAELLTDYYDDSICELVGRLGESPMLAQIRSEALSARMIAVLHAIERHGSSSSASSTRLPPYSSHPDWSVTTRHAWTSGISRPIGWAASGTRTSRSMRVNGSRLKRARKRMRPMSS